MDRWRDLEILSNTCFRSDILKKVKYEVKRKYFFEKKNISSGLVKQGSICYNKNIL